MDSKLISIIVNVIFLTLTVSKDVKYVLQVGYLCGAPDGVYKCNILGFNKQFPGPVIEARIGDTLRVTVINRIEDHQVTTVHWHGLFQNRTGFMDGPEMITQCPIPFGLEQTYVIPLEQAGTYWYHSHVHWQYTAGMWGPLIIHDRPEVYADDYDDEIIVTLNDWYHEDGQKLMDFYLSPASRGAVPPPDSVLMNGRGVFPCDTNATTLPCDPSKQTPYVFNVCRGKRYRVRVINTSALTTFLFSIEDHTLYTIETDGVTTVKVPFESFPIAPAQRYSSIVLANGENDEYFVNAQIITPTTIFAPEDEVDSYVHETKIVPLVQGILRYKNCEEDGAGHDHDHGHGNSHHPDKGSVMEYGDPILPVKVKRPSLAELLIEGQAHNQFRFPGESLLQPHDKILAPANHDQQIVLNIITVIDEKGVRHLTFNGIASRLPEKPLLSSVLLGRSIPEYVNPIYTGHNKAVQVVIDNSGGRPHPIHLHGHQFYVMGAGIQGAGVYNSTRDILIRNGVKRDVVVVLAQSWVVIAFVSDNPGVWLLHCHINMHLLGGLGLAIIEAPKEARKVLRIPRDFKKICEYAGIEI